MKKDRIKKWLERLAEQNRKDFGPRRPDCCELNQQQMKYAKSKKGK